MLISHIHINYIKVLKLNARASKARDRSSMDDYLSGEYVQALLCSGKNKTKVAVNLLFTRSLNRPNFNMILRKSDGSFWKSGLQESSFFRIFGCPLVFDDVESISNIKSNLNTPSQFLTVLNLFPISKNNLNTPNPISDFRKKKLNPISDFRKKKIKAIFQ